MMECEVESLFRDEVCAGKMQSLLTLLAMRRKVDLFSLVRNECIADWVVELLGINKAAHGATMFSTEWCRDSKGRWRGSEYVRGQVE